ncbi:YMR241Wp-like protein [Nadsonia fulvescens var. elongata DSM 6958]|uniref:YMR241Wp-like protein n=1 Tax=Nadsonia fulvescens var. elongata DSM 6958 TaxID=857566 RepID=A0A1E3PD88_9ASCO|nr:YMR241Wp-like protein [Nadsonia fulvescens var. elongata DSM 6958]
MTTAAAYHPGEADRYSSSTAPLLATPGLSSSEPSGTNSSAANLDSSLQPIAKKKVSFSNILLGAGLNLFEVTTLGQPLEVIKTTMAANRSDGVKQAVARVWSRGGPTALYQGLYPWAWIEASTKGAVLLFVSSEVEYQAKNLFNLNNFNSGILGGIFGGLAQAYLTVGFCTCMKTVEITQATAARGAAGVAAANVASASKFQLFKQIYQKEGLRGINKGVNAVAIRQCTNWGSRFGLTRLSEETIRRISNKTSDTKLTPIEKILASTLGGGLSVWNQPIEVIRVEMQSSKIDPNRPKNLTIWSTFNYILKNNGVKGLYKGVTPRIGLGIWQTVCMVTFGDFAKEAIAKLTGERPIGKH